MMMFASHNQLHMYGFSDVQNLLVAHLVQHCTCDAQHSDTSPVKHNWWLKSSETCYLDRVKCKLLDVRQVRCWCFIENNKVWSHRYGGERLL